MKNKKKVLSCVMATILCLSFNATAFAAETPEPVIDVEQAQEAGVKLYAILDDGNIMPLSSISGYNQATLTSSAKGMLVECSASGIGGMGITVETSCSQTYNVNLVGSAGSSSLATSELNKTISTNDHKEYHNLHHSGDFRYYLIGLDGIRSGDQVFVKVWIYG